MSVEDSKNPRNWVLSTIIDAGFAPEETKTLRIDELNDSNPIRGILVDESGRRRVQHSIQVNSPTHQIKRN